MGLDMKMEAVLARMDREIAALEDKRDKILTKKDAYPENSDKAMRQVKKLNLVLQDLVGMQREKEEVFRADAFPEEYLPYMAAYHGCVHALKEFVSTMSPMTSSYLEFGDPATGNTPLHAACARGHVECAKLLIAVGASVDARNKVGFTPLHCACANGQVEIVTLLLAVPFFDPYGRDHRQQSALHVARTACLDHDSWARFKECARLLEERCCVFRGWAFENMHASGVSKLFSSQWKLRYVVILRTEATSSTLEMSLFSARERARCPPVPTSTLLYSLGYPIRTTASEKKKTREFSFSFQARRDPSSPMFSADFAAVSADGFAAWTDFFDVYSNLSTVDDVLLLRDPIEDHDDDESDEEMKPSGKTLYHMGHSHQSHSPSAPRLSSPVAMPPSAPSLALSPSAQVAFEVGHDGFRDLKKGGKSVEDDTSNEGMKKPSSDKAVSDDRKRAPSAAPERKRMPSVASSTSSTKPKLLQTLFASNDDAKGSESSARRRDCIVCFDGPQDAVCVPCGHNAICMDCAEHLMAQDTRPCPVCRKNIREVVRIYQG
ncbi:Aste57867_19099 [Aphanomyces stellatus]|uniref:Aste57867_19099 protein n=1 Tax=Aphanomyces stellatus TaxID=120398 RepID=A0A485LG15_9STRA|nr:hypothetical protein As57867_019035 [Aphanomyces stellatus]VFT95824.1 Aste57867_19099 [Aphanomyces stellatus]